jgi:hypothetical protein
MTSKILGRSPRSSTLRRIVISVALLVGSISAWEAVNTGTASACSIVDPSSVDRPLVRFTGIAKKHLLTVDGGDAETYEWTFIVTQWDRTSAGYRRTRGSKINVSIVEKPKVDPSVPTATGQPNGPAQIAPCSGIPFFVDITYQKDARYDVAALIQSGKPPTYSVGHFLGTIQSR